MISAFARSGAVLENRAYLEAAENAASFLRDHLTDPVSRELRRSWREGKVLETAFAEDYAFLIQGLLDLYEAAFEIRWIQWATELQSLMDRLFWDDEAGGYFSSPAGDPHLLVRMKEDYDGAEPSANSVAALNLLRFSRMFGHEDAAIKAEKIFALSGHTLKGMPAAVPQLLVALGYSLTPGRQMVVAGTPGDSDTQALLAVIRKGFHPDQVILLADASEDGEGQKWLAAHVPLIAGMKPVLGKAALYRCENFTCAAPVTSMEMESLNDMG